MDASPAHDEDPALPRPRDLLLVANGDPEDVHTQSGVPHHLLGALAVHHRVQPVDASLDGVGRAVAGALAWTPRSGRAHVHRSALATRLRSARVEATARAHPEADLAIVVRSMYAPLGLPYAPYVDIAIPHIVREAPERLVWRGRRLDAMVRREAAYLAGATHVFTTGHGLARSIIEGHGLDPARVTAVGGGAHFATAARPSAPEPGRILFVGYDFERKGGPDLLAAFARVRARHPGATLTLVGPRLDDPPEGVEALGPVHDRAQVQALYQRSAVFVLPSRWEPFGMSLLEAMSLSVACVATSVNAIPDIVVDGRTGLLVPPRDPDRLADALLALVEEPERALRLGVAGRARVEDEMRWDHVAGRMMDVLSEVA